MRAHDAIRNCIKMAETVTNDYLGDFSDADLLVRPVPEANHTAWQLGHLISSNDTFLRAVGANPPALPAGFAAAHHKDHARSDDPGHFATKADYLRLLAAQHEAAVTALPRFSDAELDAPGPEPIRAYAPTIGDVFLLIGMHGLMHVGCYVPVRRKLGKPILF